MGLADTNIASMPTALVPQPNTQSAVEGVQEEAAPPAAPVAQNPNEPGLKSWRLLAQKEKAVVAERQRIAQEKEQIRQQSEQLRAWREQQEAFERDKIEFKRNPNKLLDRFGLKYQDLAEYQLNGSEPTPTLEVQALRDQIIALEEKMAAKEQSKEQELQKQREVSEAATIADFQEQIHAFTRSKPDAYEFINLNEAEPLVFQVIQDYYDKSGKLISIKEAADKVEKYLENTVDKIAASKKFQAKIKAPKSREDQSPQTRTLTNEFTPTSAPQFGQTVKSEADRLNRALAALEGNKK